MASLHSLLLKTLKPFKSKIFYKEAMLIHDWENVVGAELSRGFSPIDVINSSAGRILRVQTSSSGMATATYLEPLILERVNRFFGSSYFSKIKTVHGQVKRTVKKEKVQLQSADPQNLDEALQMLGQHLKN